MASAFAAAPMVAQGASSDATGTLTPSALSNTAPAITPFSAALTGVTQTVNTGVGAWDVNDATGSSAGSSVTVAATAPTVAGSTAGAGIGGSITLTPSTATAAAGNPASTGPTASAAQALSTTAATIDNAPAGSGQGQWDFAADNGTTQNSLAVVIPGDARAGAYGSTLTFTTAPRSRTRMAKRPTMMMSSARPRAGALAVLAALALAALVAAPALAAAPPAPVVFALAPVGVPGPLLLHGSAGRVLHGAVSVRNLSRHPITVILQSAEIQNASNGNADYLTTRLSHAGRWLRLSAHTVRLGSHATRRIAFTVRIPAGSTGASHYAGIVAINAADIATAAAHRTAKPTRFTFYRINRQALPLTIRLPGRLSRALALRSATIGVQPTGAGLLLGLAPGGSELTQTTHLQLRVLRGSS